MFVYSIEHLIAKSAQLQQSDFSDEEVCIHQFLSHPSFHIWSLGKRRLYTTLYVLVVAEYTLKHLPDVIRFNHSREDALCLMP